MWKQDIIMCCFFSIVQINNCKKVDPLWRKDNLGAKDEIVMVYEQMSLLPQFSLRIRMSSLGWKTGRSVCKEENAILLTETRFRQIRGLKAGRVGSFPSQHRERSGTWYYRLGRKDSRKTETVLYDWRSPNIQPVFKKQIEQNSAKVGLLI